MTDRFDTILSTYSIDAQIGYYCDYFNNFNLTELRERRDWLKKYLQYLDEQGDHYADRLEQLDPVTDKKRYKRVDTILYGIGDTRVHAKKRLHRIEELIYVKGRKSIFCTGDDANMKALNHGGIYNNCGKDLLSGNPGLHRGIIRGVSL